MTIPEWPTGWERTPAHERTPANKFDTTIADTADAIRDELDRMNVDHYRAAVGRTNTAGDGMPLYNADPDDPGFALRWTKDGDDYAVACDKYGGRNGLRDNMRAVYLWLHETRLSGNRPVKTGRDTFAAAELPSGDTDAPTRRDRPAHEVLQVKPDAPDAVVEASYRELVKERHPDNGGSEAAFKELQEAKEAMLGDSP